jgi:hypothetical protein
MLFIPDFGEPKRPKIPVTFTYYGEGRTGSLSEITGWQYAWWLHADYSFDPFHHRVNLVDVLIWDNCITWKEGNGGLPDQEAHFLEVIISHYQ